jgi:cysteine-rich repeat protein
VIEQPEECEDGNFVSGDGCDPYCQYEHTCGDGVIELGEECDDGNTNGLDGCSASCTEEICLIELPGDATLSGEVNAADIIFSISWIFKGGPGPLPCHAAGDVNCSGLITSADIIYLVEYVFKSGAPPCDICNDSPLGPGCI